MELADGFLCRLRTPVVSSSHYARAAAATVGVVVVIALVRALAIQDLTPGETFLTDAEHRPLPVMKATLD